MRHQERNVSEFDEIITYPPSAAPSGEKQVMSCVQAFTAALGFAMSAGWDWLPSMHTLWLRDYIEAVSMPTPFGFFGTLSGSIFFKMIMLLALCPVMERLFHAFPLDRVAFRRKPFPNADYYLSTPLILAQLCAILLLLVLTFSLPPCLDGLMPWLLGTVSALFGLIWFVLVTLLPGVWSGISYGLAITFSILISLLLDTAPAESLARFRMLFPILAIPLIFFAMPPSDDIRRRIRATTANACSRLGSRASSCAGFCCAAFPIWIFSPSREASIWFCACSQLCMVFRFYLISQLVVRWCPST